MLPDEMCFYGNENFIGAFASDPPVCISRPNSQRIRAFNFQQAATFASKSDEATTLTVIDADSTQSSNTSAVATSGEVGETPTEKVSAPDVASQNSSMVNMRTDSVKATSESSIYNASSLEPVTRNDTTSGGPFERVLLRNYTLFHVYKGKFTVRRRTRPSEQLE